MYSYRVRIVCFLDTLRCLLYARDISRGVTSLFIFYMEKVKHFLHTFWHIVRWPFYVLLALYIGLVVYRIPAAMDRNKTQQAIDFIHSQKITLADVMGTNLPPPPDVAKNNATVEGIDVNNNGIRDDVELAIFKLHPNEAKVRAAELQYALGIQIMMTKVNNSDTWKVAADKKAFGHFCIAQITPKAVDRLAKEVEDLVLNLDDRKQAYGYAFNFISSYGSYKQNPCDVDLASLPN